MRTSLAVCFCSSVEGREYDILLKSVEQDGKRTTRKREQGQLTFRLLASSEQLAMAHLDELKCVALLWLI